MEVRYNDGGRTQAGYKGTTGDCVCRAICITTGLPYQQVYDRLAEGNATQRKVKGQRGGKFSNKGQRTAARGIYVRRKWFRDYMTELGFEWVPTMFIGQGCKVHLTDGELPMGRLIVSVSKHLTCVIDGVIYDIYDPQRNITWINGDGSTSIQRRCVYGYFILKQ